MKSTYWAVLSCGAVYYIVQGVSNFKSVDEILKCDHSNESYWAVLSCGAVYYIVQGVSNFKSVDEILKCDHSNESYWAVLSCGAVYYADKVVLRFDKILVVTVTTQTNPVLNTVELKTASLWSYSY